MTNETTPALEATTATTPSTTSASSATAATAVLPPVTSTTPTVDPAPAAPGALPPTGGYGAPAPAPTAYQAPTAHPAPATGESTTPYAYRRTNTLGIVTLVLGILGFGLVPVITGHTALSQIKKRGEDGYGITLAGLILGYVTLVGWLLVLLFWIGAAGLAIFGALLGTAY